MRSRLKWTGVSLATVGVVGLGVYFTVTGLGFDTADKLANVTGAFLAAAGLILTARSASLSSVQANRPEVSMGVPATRPQVSGIPQVSVTGTETPRGLFRQTAPTIDVRLVNNGAGTAIITGCEVHVLWAKRFPTLQPPVVKIDRNGAALLPASAHYMALLPGPEDAVGLNIDGSRDQPILPRDPEGLGPSHELEPGKADRFIIRLEAEPHGGGTWFEHPMPWDDQFIYVVRLTLRYDGDRQTREISTGEIAVGFPANVFVIPSPDEIRSELDKFRRSVESTQREIDAKFRNSGIESISWSTLRAFLADPDGTLLALTSRQARTVRRILRDERELTDAFFRPERAAREFVSQCEDFYSKVIAEMYTSTEDTRQLRNAAMRYRAELRRNPDRYR
ncbi:hypothetical protein [Actinomadura sp. 9N215]|uniref:hypothetical protein n=1 Tax=Actinomadura sp. 9N215 TaxID=3375150 RepID=UPI0037A4230E